MILEVLPAAKGDCMLLHAQSAGKPTLIVIDGGPAGVSDTLIARLEQIKQERVDDEVIGEDDPLTIDLLMVSHVDDDHINGIIDLLEAMKDRRQAGQRPLFVIKELWHNSFDRILGNDQVGGLQANAQFGAASLAPMMEEEEAGFATDHLKVLASVKQGDDLQRLADLLDIPINASFGGELIRTVPGQRVAVTVGGIEWVVLGPLEPELRDLQEQYDTWLRTRPKHERTEASLLAGLDDKSVANLSSIVLLARDGGRSILFTGDARSDKVLDGLKDAGICGDGEILHVDILKMPHHGSIRNLDDEGDFLRRITAPAYVFSGDGEHGNPDRETFDLLFRTRPGAAMDLYLTYAIDETDERREEVHEHEREKRRRRRKAEGPAWSAQANSLAAVLSAPPNNVTVRAGAPFRLPLN
jgi:glyoxylase-like metal-dependent hydrolase (beta-lactamase superfamily II)